MYSQRKHKSSVNMLLIWTTSAEACRAIEETAKLTDATEENSKKVWPIRRGEQGKVRAKDTSPDFLIQVGLLTFSCLKCEI